MNRNGLGKNLRNNNMNKNGKKHKNPGIFKRLASPQLHSNNKMGYNNQNNIRNKYNPAKHRMPSPAIKSSNFSKRPFYLIVDLELIQIKVINSINMKK